MNNYTFQHPSTSIENVKRTTNMNNNKNSKYEEELSLNNYNPIKGSPNMFLQKLQFRLSNYNLEMELL